MGLVHKVGVLKCIFPLIFLVVNIVHAQEISSPAVGELKGKYTFGSVYLTYTLLHDYQQHLNDPSKKSAIDRASTARDVVALFRGYLDGVAVEGADISRSTAFLQLDLNTGVAGFKRSSDRDGVITKLPWTPQQVIGIALLCDKLANGQTKIESALGDLEKGTKGIADGWKAIKDFRNDPFVQTTSLSRVLIAFDGLTSKKSEELTLLKKNQFATFEEIDGFRKEFAKTKPRSEVPFVYPFIFALPQDDPKRWNELLAKKRVSIDFTNAAVGSFGKATGASVETIPVLSVDGSGWKIVH